MRWYEAPEKRADVVAIYREHGAVAHVATVLGRDVKDVRIALRIEGIPTRKPPARRVPIDPDDVISKYERGESIRAIAWVLGVDAKRVSEIVHAAGITRPPGRPRTYSDEDMRIAQELREKGHTERDIADVLGCHPATAHRLIHGVRR